MTTGVNEMLLIKAINDMMVRDIAEQLQDDNPLEELYGVNIKELKAKIIKQSNKNKRTRKVIKNI